MKPNCRNRAMSRSIAILCLVSTSLVSCLFVVLLPKALLTFSSCLVLSSSISSIHPWFFSSWQSFCQVAFAPTRDQRPARQKSTASGWSFRFSSYVLSQSRDITLLCRRVRWWGWKGARWRFARTGKFEPSTSLKCPSLLCLPAAVRITKHMSKHV